MIFDFYHCELGAIVMCASERGLSGLYFANEFDLSESKMRGASAISEMLRNGDFARRVGLKSGNLKYLHYLNLDSQNSNFIDDDILDDGQKNVNNKQDFLSGAKSFLTDTRRWLDLYFARKKPDFLLKLDLQGSAFELRVWDILLRIEYGELMTYGQIAKMIARDLGLQKMSAQAVGGAVGRNKISIIVPCHRVIGANGNLTGYAAGLDKKIALLEIESVNMENLKMPKTDSKNRKVR